MPPESSNYHWDVELSLSIFPTPNNFIILLFIIVFIIVYAMSYIFCNKMNINSVLKIPVYLQDYISLFKIRS